MATIWVVIITMILTLIVGVVGGYTYRSSWINGVPDIMNGRTSEEFCVDEGVCSQNDVEDSGGSKILSIDTSNWKTLEFDAGASIKYPSDWEITDPNYSIEGVEIYMINEDNKGGSGGVYLYDLDEWIKGPNPEDGYVMQKNKREAAYQTMLNIYSDRKLSPESRIELNDYGLEFFTYSMYDRADVKYIESDDGNSRGFTMINSYGQDVGLAADYVTSLFNQTENTVLKITMPISSDYSEISELIKQYGDYSQNADELTEIDRSVHQDFIQLMLSDRADLTFSNYLDQIDTIAESVTY